MEELYPDSFLCPTGGGMLEVMFWITEGDLERNLRRATGRHTDGSTGGDRPQAFVHHSCSHGVAHSGSRRIQKL